MKRAFLIAVFVLVSIFPPVAPGGAPMGPPTATLGRGQWSLGAEYAREDVTLDASGACVATFGGVSSYTQAFTIEDLTGNMFFANLAYGLSERWDIFARLGVANAQDDVAALDDQTAFLDDPIGFDGGYGFAGGVGTRITFGRRGPWSVSGLAQATWFFPGAFHIGPGGYPAPDAYTFAGGDVKLDYWQVQAALSATYRTGPWHFWGGPFIQFTLGDLDVNLEYAGGPVGTGGRIHCSAGLDDNFRVGGFLGAGWQVTDRWSLQVEGQVAEDFWLVGVGGIFYPQKSTR